VIVLASTDGRGDAATVQASLLKAIPLPPIEVHNLPEEIRKVGSDMFIALAMENMRIYLAGGLLLALIAILAVAMANYAEDQRTFALLRIRGASPQHIRRFLLAMLLSPALLGLALGGLTALLAGFGLTNYVWKLRELKTVVQLLRTHLVISSLTIGVAAILVVLLLGVAFIFSAWVFRRTARETMMEG
jgi:ABC-type lipoprotein release transport system permease subunit